LSDCTNDDDADDDDSKVSSSSSSSSIQNEEKQSLMRSFGVAVEYFDGTQLPPAATSCAAKTRPISAQSPTSTKSVRKSEIVYSAPTKGRRDVEDPSAKLIHLPSTLPMNGACWSLRCAESTVLDSCAGGSNFRGQWLIQPGSGPNTSYTTVFMPVLRSASTTTSATSASDEPEDLSVRTSARHVTAADRSPSPTIAISSNFQHAQLPGKVCIHKEYTHAFILPAEIAK